MGPGGPGGDSGYPLMRGHLSVSSFVWCLHHCVQLRYNRTVVSSYHIVNIFKVENEHVY